MPQVQESSNNHFVPVGSIFVKEAQQRVIEENGSLVTPAYSKEKNSDADNDADDHNGKK